MKKIFFLTMALLASVNTAAQAVKDSSLETTLSEAPQEIVQVAIEQCKGWAKEDGISETDLSAYLLSCVNQELEVQDFLPVEALDE
jgi:hypothetical protein